MVILLNTWLKKASLLAPLIMLAAWTGYQLTKRSMAEECLRRDPTSAGVQKAVLWDRHHSTYHYYLGRVYHYSVDSPDIARALSSYHKAIALNPLVAGYWLDLGKAYGEACETRSAEEAVALAVRLDPRSPQMQWEAANYWLGRGNREKAFEHFKAAASFDENRISAVLALCWKVTSDHERVLRDVVPDTLVGNLATLNLALERREYSLAGRAWQRLLQNSTPGFTVDRMFAYIDALLLQQQIPSAQRVWRQTLAKCGLNRETPARSAPTNLMYNGRFETEPVNGGFDWRKLSGPGFAFSWDGGNHRQGGRALRIDFNGSENVDFYHLFQIVSLGQTLETPDEHYELVQTDEPAGPKTRLARLSHAFDSGAALSRKRTFVFSYGLRTLDLSTDQGVYWEIFGYPNNQQALMRSEMYTGMSPWIRRDLEFSIDDSIQSLMIRLRRVPSRKIDCFLKGKVWLDDVVLHERSRGSSDDRL
ncbi:MAG: tetratricopeptide repeat protein [Acidobacteria bacterium]|nr:tetratricopeptide repeat protein [Acidobacteriota bacterium]MBI3658204.1 tetratricopeptide repeat protein [Acidobacteriota bacterium]